MRRHPALGSAPLTTLVLSLAAVAPVAAAEATDPDLFLQQRPRGEAGPLWRDATDETTGATEGWTNKVEVADIDGLRIVDHGSSAFFYFSEEDPARATGIRDAVNASWKHGRAYLREELPKEWHVPANSDFAEIILQPDPGYLVFSTEARIDLKPNGSHGWTPDTQEMHATFLAYGPRLPEEKSIGAINSVDVYPLLMEILGLPITTPIDGDPSKLVPLLK